MRVHVKATKIFAKKGNFMEGEFGLWTKPDGRICFKLEKEFGNPIWIWLSPEEACTLASKITNYCYPHTTAVKGREERLKKNGFTEGKTKTNMPFKWASKPASPPPRPGVMIRDPGPKTFKYWDTPEGRMEYINQGCHRP